MPFLPQEPHVFPSDLLETSIFSNFDTRSWRVLHIRPRQEKSLARELLDARIPFFLPLYRKRSLIRGRTIQAFLPLFPGYLFLFSKREECFRAMGTRRVVRALDVNDQQKLLEDLQNINALLASGKPITPETQLATGATVEIRHGALAGLKGKIIRAASGNRFLVQVDFLQQGASIVIEDSYLVAIREYRENQACRSA